VKDPLSWIPDPKGNHIDKFRFHYFEEQMMKSSMSEDYGFIKSEVDKLTFVRNEDTETTNSYKDNAQGLNNTDD
jgi:hypothetical protein